jgi:hypothetical protein
MMVGNNLKMKNMKKIILFSLFLAFITSACYDSYETDFENTAAYFSYQYPVRSVIIDPTVETFEIKVGVVYGGKYSYDGATETVNFVIADTLINNNTEYTDMGIKVMPSNWYSLSDESEISMVNSNVGFVNVSIIRDSLVKYPNASLNTYAIPFVMTETSADSIIEGKNFSIVVVKFKNEFDGRYYVKGKDDELNTDGTVASTMEYNNPSLVLNKYIFLNSIEKDVVAVPRIGSNEDKNEFVYNMKFRSSDGSALLVPTAGSQVTELVGAAQFDYAKKLFVCNYYYKLKGTEHSVVDTLIYSNTEMLFESWK